ncbi:hypothetical protein GCM10027060_13280 [Nesterenkonia halophila]
MAKGTRPTIAARVRTTGAPTRPAETDVLIVVMVYLARGRNGPLSRGVADAAEMWHSDAEALH